LQEAKDNLVESELRGPTLRVYWHILSTKKKEGIGVRSVQRALGMSSPSVALHHLEKLRTLGLLEKQSSGEYHLVSTVKVGVLQNYVGLFGYMLPRFLFYSTLFTTMLVLYPLLYPFDLSTHNVMALIFGGTAAGVCWIETYRVWKRKPF
jgi:DNA-binding transcriptional ArsR family regulator